MEFVVHFLLKWRLIFILGNKNWLELARYILNILTNVKMGTNVSIFLFLFTRNDKMIKFNEEKGK